MDSSCSRYECRLTGSIVVYGNLGEGRTCWYICVFVNSGKPCQNRVVWLILYARELMRGKRQARAGAGVWNFVSPVVAPMAFGVLACFWICALSATRRLSEE